MYPSSRYTGLIGSTCKAKACTVWAHGFLGIVNPSNLEHRFRMSSARIPSLRVLSTYLVECRMYTLGITK